MTTRTTSFTAQRSCGVPLGFVFIYLAWGGTYLGTKFAIVDLPVLSMAGARFFFAGALLLAGIGLLDRTNFRRGTIREWVDAARIGVLLLVLGIGTGNWTQQFVNSSFCAMIFSALPLWIVVIDWLRPGGNAPSRTVIGGLLLGFAGVALILAPQHDAGGKPANLAIDVLLVLASISWAAGAVFSRTVRTRGSALLATARQLVVAGVVLVAIGAMQGDFAHLQLSHVRPSAWAGFAYLLFIGSFSGYPVYLWLMRTCPPSKVATIPYVNLIVAIFLGWTLGHETITTRLLTGTAIVLVSVAIVLRAKEHSLARPNDTPLTEEQLPAPVLRTSAGLPGRRS